MQQDTSDLFYRIEGGVMILSGLWNALLSFIWFFALVWVAVGCLWIIPGVLSLCYVGAGIYLLATGRQTRAVAFIPIGGIVVSMLNLNIIGGMLDLVALVLGIIGYSQSDPKQLEGR